SILVSLCDCGSKLAVVHAEEPLARHNWRRLQKLSEKEGFNLTYHKKCLNCGREIKSPAPAMESTTEQKDPMEQLLQGMKALNDKALCLNRLQKALQNFDETRRLCAVMSKAVSVIHPVRDNDIIAKRLEIIVAIDALCDELKNFSMEIMRAVPA